MFGDLWHRVNLFVRQLLHNEQLLMLVLAVVMGALAAYAAIGFRFLYLLVQGLGLGTFADTLYIHAASLPAWQIIAVPAIGGLFIGLFIHFFMPNRRPQGVADVMEAAALRSGRMTLRDGLGAAVVSAASIGVGASVGREGPVVHLGASLCSALARSLGLSRSLVINLLGCGVASAIAVSFNAPIAGTFFALEVIIGHYALTAFAPIVLASVTGTVIARVQFGDFPAFVIPANPIAHWLEFPAFVLLAIVCAITACILMWSISFAQKTSEKVPLPRWSHAMFGGALVGVIALAFPQVLGVGYGTTDAALKGSLEFELLIMLIVAKTAAVAISLGSGFGGGVFSPSLFVGAMLGGAFGIVATSFFPDMSSGHTAYTLVGMAAVAGAVLGAPISTFLIVFELTRDYHVTIAVMVAVVIASMLTQAMWGGSFFTWQLEKRGTSLKRGREEGLLAETHVGDIMSGLFVTVSPAAGLKAIRNALHSAPHAQIFVVDTDGKLFGTITLGDLSDAAFDPNCEDVINAADVARTHPPVLTPGVDLDGALKLMEDSHEEHIAVVKDRDSMEVLGVVHEVDVTLAYNRALMRARAEEHGEL